MQKKLSQFELSKYIHEHVNSDNSGLDMKEYLTLLSLSMFINSATQVCNPSKATLASRSCMSVRTVDVAVNSLVAKGFLTYEKGSLIGTLRKPNSYTFMYDKIYACVKTPWIEPVAAKNTIPAPEVEVVADPFDSTTAREVKPVRGVGDNADGSKPYHTNGTRCFSFEDHKRATAKANEADEDSLF